MAVCLANENGFLFWFWWSGRSECRSTVFTSKDYEEEDNLNLPQQGVYLSECTYTYG